MVATYSEYKRLLQKGEVNSTYGEWCTYGATTSTPLQPTLKDKLWECYGTNYKETYIRWLKYKAKTRPFGVDGFIHYLKKCHEALYTELLNSVFSDGFDLLKKYDVGLNNTLQVKIETLFEGLPYEEDIPKTPITDVSRAISGRMVGLVLGDD